MSKPTNQTDQLLRQMSNAPLPCESGYDRQSRQRRVVPHVSAAIRRSAQQRDARRRWSRRAPFAAIAASVLLVFGVVTYLDHSAPPQAASEAATHPSNRLHTIEGTVLINHGGAIVRSGPNSDYPLEPGVEVRTSAEARATMLLDVGIMVDVGGASSVAIARPDEPTASTRLLLTRGRVDVSVPRLAPGTEFVVRTPHAEVVVHGTYFSVVVEDSASQQSITRVEVTEGVVAVRRDGAEVLLTGGKAWTSEASDETACAASSSTIPTRGERGTPHLRKTLLPTPALSHAARPPESVIVATPEAGALSEPETPLAASVRSSLAEENRIFQAAMDAKRRGDDMRVVAGLSELLAKYPGSPLAPNARVERFRALNRMGDTTAAAREARKYLAENPDGFARDEARGAAMTRPADSRGSK